MENPTFLMFCSAALVFACTFAYRILPPGSMAQESTQYCQSSFTRQRFPTHTVKIGRCSIGSKHPIAIQTMTSCDTNDVDATVDQILKAEQYGAQIVRLTVQSPREIKASYQIKDKLVGLACTMPLVADIHFNPKVALMAAEIYDKVRVNPGNYVDGRKDFENKVYNSLAEFKEAGKRIGETFAPLVEKCKELKKAIRIGTNHGSLSSRVMSFYGDTPKGMVESAFEFVDICRELDFDDVVISLKSSNTLVMVHAYRHLVNEYIKRGYTYPIHLGVTEAGSVDDGRAKSALGIGALLLDGIGDTIRMSLTEDPWLEVPPCRKLLQAVDDITNLRQQDGVADMVYKDLETTYKDVRNFNEITRRPLDFVSPQMASIGTYARAQMPLLTPSGAVGCRVSPQMLNDPENLYKALRARSNKDGLAYRAQESVDVVLLDHVPEFHESEAQRIVKELIEAGFCVVANVNELNRYPIKFALGLIDLDNLQDCMHYQGPENVNAETGEAIVDYCDRIYQAAIRITGLEAPNKLQELVELEQAKTRPVGAPRPAFIILDVDPSLNYMATVRTIFARLIELGSKLPVLHYINVAQIFNREDMLIYATSRISSHLLDRFGEGIILDSALPLRDSNDIAFTILQAARMRSTRTDIISCPSCGRTLFNIQETTKEVKRRVGHLPGVSIAIMGCIVNGIGEMADADFGYVGGAPGKVDFYVKKELVERGVPYQEACEKFIQLIKKHGKWVDPPPETKGEESS